jgi:hypothetical protein
MIRRIIKLLSQNRIKNSLIMSNKCTFSRKAILNSKTICGKHVYLGAGNFMDSEIGDFSYVGSGTFRNVKIGKLCSISTNVHIVAFSHPLEYVSTSPAFLKDTKCLMKGKVGSLSYSDELLTDKGFFVKLEMMFGLGRVY